MTSGSKTVDSKKITAHREKSPVRKQIKLDISYLEVLVDMTMVFQAW